MTRKFKIYLAIFAVVLLGVGVTFLYNALSENMVMLKQAETSSTATVAWAAGETTSDSGVTSQSLTQTTAGSPSLTQPAAATATPTAAPTTTHKPTTTAAPTPVPPIDTTAGATAK